MTNSLLEVVLSAQSILDITSSPSTSVTKLVKNSGIDANFQAGISNLYDVCGSRIIDDSITLFPPNFEEPELPGFCSTSPFANLTDFLWKPVSEKNGSLVILTNPAASIVVNGETLSEYGASNNFCSTARASKSGASFGKAYLSVNTASRFYVIEIPNGQARYDCKGNLSNCGINVYEEYEIKDLQKKLKKFKKKSKKAKRNGKISKFKKFKKKIKKIKPIIKAATSQGF